MAPILCKKVARRAQMKTNEAGGVELVVAESSEKQPDIIRAVSSELVGTALSEYQRIQQALDKALPDCIMQIGDKQFRKKNYWRAVATAFNLQIEEVEGSEQVERKPDGAPLSVSVTYRASASNGRSATGDGACEAAEKVVYLWRDNERTDEPDERKTKANQTLHNIRAHAHTRAYNRAVSNLVGFGEVSAEEIYEPTPLPKRPAPPPPAPVPSDPTPPPPPAAEGGGVEILPAWLDEAR
jgi:hypothetical protein